MRTQHLLLLSSLALSGPALGAEPKPAANASREPGTDTISKTDAAGNTAAGDETTPARRARKDRIRYTFPPAPKRM